MRSFLKSAMAPGIRKASLALAAAVLPVAWSATAHAEEKPVEERIKALLDINELERFHSVYGYQQDKSLFNENVDLFVEKGSSTIFQNALYKDKTGIRRMWLGNWGRLTYDAYMMIDGLMNDHLMFQPVFTLSEDRQSAKMRARGRGYITTFDGDIGKRTIAFGDHYVKEDGTREATGNLSLVQDYIYENTFVKDNGTWKLKDWNICIYATSSYSRGYADLPIPGKMGNGPDVKPGERRHVDLEEGKPENPQELFPGNPNGPDQVLTPEDTGCYVAKNQIMSRSAVVPFHYPNPVTGQPVVWENR
jgi:hypothetical protein